MKIILALCFFQILFTSLFSQTSEHLHFNRIIARLKNNQPIVGVMVAELHPSTAMALVEANEYPAFRQSMSRPMIDYIIIEFEHGPHYVSELRSFLHALNSKREVLAKGNLQPNIATLVRLPSEGPDPVHVYIKQILDLGVHGVVIPNVRTADQVEQIIRSMRYPRPKDCPFYEPAGLRGIAPWIAAYQWGISNEEYMERADLWPLNPNGDLLAIIMIVTPEGVANIDKILRVPGIGAVMLGPGDYSMFAGYPMETDHPVVLKAQKIVEDACNRANILYWGPGVFGLLPYRDSYRRFDKILRVIEEKFY